MKQISKRFLSVFLSLMLVMSMITSVVPAFAESTETDASADLTICTADELVSFAETVTGGNNFEGKVVKLGADIDLSEIKWAPIGGEDVYFAGEFDGAGYTISNLTQTDGARMGLFGLVEKSYIHDITLADVSFTVGSDSARVGAIAGNLQYWNVVEDVTVDGIEITVDGNDGLIGVVAGYVWKSQLGNVDVKDVVFNVNGTGNVVGGNTAYGRGHVWDTGVTGNNAHWLDGTVQDINGTEYVLQNYWVDCDVENIEINLNGTGSEAGGFFGSDTYNSHSNYFVDCHVTGLQVNVKEETSQIVGGFIAWNNGTTEAGTVKGFTDCSSSGEINADGATGIYGGFAGQVGGRACAYNSASADVDIVCGGTAGGFVGAAQAYSTHKYTFNDCFATGDVEGNVAGGFAGKNGLSGDGKSVFVEYNGCSASGKVVGTTYAGGFVGEVNTELPATNWNIVDSTGSLELINNTASTDVTGGTVGALIGYLDGVANDDAKEGNKLNIQLIGNTPADGINLSDDTPADDIVKTSIARVGSAYYETLEDAVVAANGVENGATVELFTDVTLGKKLSVSGNVTVKGGTITRADGYTGTLFDVGVGATLTLDGGLVIDGGNNYAFDSALYAEDLADWTVSVPSAESAKWFTPEEGAPVATAYMITTSGNVNLNDVTVKNNYSTNGSGIVSASRGAKVVLEGAQITHNASTSGSGLVVNASAGVWSREEELITVIMNEGTVIDGNHVGGNHGIFKIYMGTYFTMNGGEVKNTTGWNSNGSVVGIYHAVFTMNGGTICSNSSVYGPNNGRNAAIYGHSNHLFTMNGGTICHNTGRSKAGIDSPYSETGYTGQTYINGGSVLDNTVVGTWTEPDVSGGATLTVKGGTFSQDVTKYLVPDLGMEKKADGTYGITEDLYEYNGQGYKTLAEVIAAVKSSKARSAAPVVDVLASHKVDDAVVIDTDLVLNLNGYSITGVDVYPVIRVQGDVNVTVKNGTVINGDYVFVLGASDGSSAGNLTIESGKYHGQTTVASVTKGTLTVLGGEFSVDPYNESYDFLLNCIDANYRNGTASIVVKGGTFYGFNPADNAAENPKANFVAHGYLVEKDGDYYTVRINRDTLDAVVVVTFDDSDTDSEVTLKYPSERFNTIQKLIGTNNYADFVIGSEQSELLAYIADGRASNIVIDLYDDIELNSALTFYNKYYNIPVTYSVTVNGNGNKITWADGYNGTLINVESGVNVTLENVVIDGENEFTFYNDTAAVENGQNWYTRFVNVGIEDKAVNSNVIVNAGGLALKDVTIKNVTIASDGDNGKTSNTDNGGYYLMYNDDLAIIKSNGGKVTVNGGEITGNAGLILNAVNAETALNTSITNNMSTGDKGGIIIANGGAMDIKGAITYNKAMARSATILGVINGAEVTFSGVMNNNKHLGVGSNTAGAMVVLEGASQFVMNGGSISDNVGGRAGAIASRWVGGTYGQHEDTSIVLNAGVISGNTATNDSWSNASVFLRSPAVIGDGMTINGDIVVNSAPGELKITGGKHNGTLTVTNGLKAEISGGTFSYDPTPWLANGLVANDLGNGTYGVETAINVSGYDKVTGEKFSIEFNSDNFGCLTYVEMMDHTNYNWVLTIDADIKVTKPIVINKDLTINLNGHTLTGVDVYPVIRVQGGANVTVKGGKIVNATDYVFVLGASDNSSAGNLTIESGYFEGQTTVASVTKGTLTILGGEFKAAEGAYGSDFLLNCIDANYRNGTASIIVKGGTFHGFNPEDNVSENPKANFVHEDYKPVDNGDGTYTVVSYVKWVQEQLFAGNDVTLDRDIVISDYDLVHAHAWPSNSNGKYNEVHGNGAIFHIIKPGVVLDLNGYSITWDAHHDDYCNKRQVALFMVTATGVADEVSDFTVKDSIGTGKVNVYGMASGMYVVLTTAKATIEGGTWTNHPCKTCGASNIFIYPSHGATLEITGGTFEQKDSEYLLGLKGSSEPTTGNSVGVDYDQTKVVITGGTFVGFNPEEVKFFDTANSGQETINGCDEGFIAPKDGDGNYTVKEGVWVAKIGDDKYESLAEALEAAMADQTVVLVAEEVAESIVIIPNGVTLNLNGHYITAGNVLSLGNVIDNNGTVDGEGGIVITNDRTKAFVQLQADNTYLPLYDAANGCYRFYAKEFSVLSLAESTDGGSVTFKFRLKLSSAYAYKLLADIDNSGLSFGIDLTWTGFESHALYAVTDDTIVEYGNLAYEQAASGASMQKAIAVTVYGLDGLESGAVMTAAPTITSVTGVSIVFNRAVDGYTSYTVD